MYLRSSKKHRRDISLDDPIGADKEGNELTLSDLLGSEPDTVVDEVDFAWEKQKMYEHLPALGKREREVICKRYGLPGGEEQTQREIARTLAFREAMCRVSKRKRSTNWLNACGRRARQDKPRRLSRRLPCDRVLVDWRASAR